MEDRLQDLLRIALAYQVTDIHFSLLSQKEEVAIEMRVHGTMEQLKPQEDDLRLFHYLMYRANLDLSRVSVPQTGSFEEEVVGTVLSLRFALVTSYRLTSGVLRILNHSSRLQIDDLTRDRQAQGFLHDILQHRTGLFVLSGPTGSGKTTSLYTLLNSVSGRKIYTLEDPVEVINPAYVQLQINDKQHMSYAEGIKQLMRHDPDIIMIGEIRDSEAAVMAVRCALTGHLVLTSLHASSCTSAILRLLDLGVKDYQLKDVLGGISNQRLYPCSQGMTGIYEIMDRKEVDYWFANKETSEDFIPLSAKASFAAANGIIEKMAAAADFTF